MGFGWSGETEGFLAGGYRGIFEDFHRCFQLCQVAIAAAMWAGGEFNSLS